MLVEGGGSSFSFPTSPFESICLTNARPDRVRHRIESLGIGFALFAFSTSGLVADQLDTLIQIGVALAGLQLLAEIMQWATALKLNRSASQTS